MEDRAKYQMPGYERADEILSQAVSDVATQLEQQKEEILREVLALRRPDLAALPSKELGELLTAYTFGAGHQLLVESETGEPIVYFQPAEMETKFDQQEAYFVANVKYLAGHAGAQEFYRLRAQHHVMD